MKRVVEWIVGWILVLIFTNGCTTPTGFRPSTFTVYGEGGGGADGLGHSRDMRGGVSVEFEFTYPEEKE